MDKLELISQTRHAISDVGFGKDVGFIIKSDYGMYMEKIISIWLPNQVHPEEYVDRVVDSLIKNMDNYPPFLDMKIILEHLLRQILIDDIRMKKLHSKSLCPMLSEYADNQHDTVSAINENSLNITLSFFSRRMFDYFIERYYRFNSLIEYNKFLEWKIARLFRGKSDTKALFIIKRIRPYPTGAVHYIDYLCQMPIYFIEQIEKKGMLLSHPDSSEHYLLQRISGRHLRSFPYVVIICLVFLLFLAIQIILE